MMINRRKVKLFALEMAKSRAHKFTRISNEFLDRCEAQLKVYIRDQVHRHPSVGKTIK